MLRVALLQLASNAHSPSETIEKGEAACRHAAALGAHLCLFPEVWNIGYSCGFDPEAADPGQHWADQAVARDGEFVGHFRSLAGELGLAIAVTYLERWPGGPRNTVTLIDRHGRDCLTFAKVHTCDFFAMESYCTPGDGFPVATLDTPCGEVEVGAMICHDREHPESARLLMLGGAELILTPNACGLDSLRLEQFRTRAWENSVAVAMANYPASHRDGNGHSVAFTANGDLLVEAGPEEGVYVANLDLEGLRAYRRKSFWGNAYRRPHRYGALASEEVREPFAGRQNGLGESFERLRR